MLTVSGMAAAGKHAVGARVMSRNLFIGGDVFAAIDVGDPSEIPEAAGNVLAEIVASDFEAHAELLADEIRRCRPQAGLRICRAGNVGASSASTPIGPSQRHRGGYAFAADCPGYLSPELRILHKICGLELASCLDEAGPGKTGGTVPATKNEGVSP